MFSKPYINKMLQATNAKTLPNQLNSVRHIEPYEGSMKPHDLLNLYVGNKHYRQINKALRAPNIQTAQREVWDESGLMKPSALYDPRVQPFLNSDYVKNSMGLGLFDSPGDVLESALEGGKYYGKSLLSQYGANNIDKGIKKSAYSIETHPLYFTDGFKDKPLYDQVQEIANFNPQGQPGIQDRIEAQKYFNQVLASAPHIEEAFKKTRPQFGTDMASGQTTNMFDEYVNQYETLKNNPSGDDDYISFFEHFPYKLQQSFLGLGDEVFDKHNLAPYGEMDADQVYKFAKEQVKTGNNDYGNLSRGLHFKDPSQLKAFVDAHQPGSIVEYPAFTSTTFNPNIQSGFSEGRYGEAPVLMTIRPKPETNIISTAYDAANPAESEFTIMPGARLKVINRLPIPATDSNPAGYAINVEDATGELTQTEQRTKNILSRMKPRLANLARVEPEPGYRMASFEQRPDGYVQSYVNQDPYKLLTQQEADAAIEKLKPNPQWQMAYRNM